MKKYKLALIPVLLAFSPLSFAQDKCSVDLEGNDAMRFDKEEIVVDKSCDKFTINLKHVGTLAKNIMGHNVVITKTSDLAGVDKDGISAGLDNNYVKPGDERVIAHSDVIGGGQNTSISFNPKDMNGDYSFFCSFPGHSTLMKGNIKLVN